MTVLDIVGKAKIADRLRVARNTVDYWRAHNGFPEPVAIASLVESGPGSYPVWLWSQVEEWHHARFAYPPK